jgi:hypothetical protein
VTRNEMSVLFSLATFSKNENAVRYALVFHRMSFQAAIGQRVLVEAMGTLHGRGKHFAMGLPSH